MTGHHFPVVLGRDFAGLVEAAGRGVQSLRHGEAVFGVVARTVLGDGAFGEYVIAQEAYTARIPAELDLATAGALGLGGTAALAAIDALDPLPGDRLLISGATAGVGRFAAQLAMARGAYVVATARAGEDDTYLRDLGARDTADFTGDVPMVAVALRLGGIRAVLHRAGDSLELADILVPGGQLGRAVQATPITAVPSTQTLERLAAEVIDGQLTVPVQRTYALADLPRALADFAAGTSEKLAISVA
jgi:NADPH:quinone reductase-like Zn-dependent oxidoreductase